MGTSAVALDQTAGSGVVVWSADDGSGNRRVYARRIDAEGQPAGEPTQLSTLDNDPQGPQIAFNPRTREYLVLWLKVIRQDDREPFSGAGSRPQLFQSAARSSRLAAR